MAPGGGFARPHPGDPSGSPFLFQRIAPQGGIAERKAMIDREHDLPISKQAQVLRISGSPAA
jgi:hypothetical protein